MFPSRFYPQAGSRATDAVPDAVATTRRDGAYYVGELTGVPFTPGLANVWRVVPGQAPEVYCSGFSFIIDLAFDRRGNLYVLENASGPNGPFLGTPGRLLRVGRDCTRTPVATGLPAPTSVAIGPDGDAYLTVERHLGRRSDRWSASTSAGDTAAGETQPARVIARLHGAPPRLRMPGPAHRELPPFQVQVFVGGSGRERAERLRRGDLALAQLEARTLVLKLGALTQTSTTWPALKLRCSSSAR